MYDEVMNFEAEYASQVIESIPVGYVDKTATGIGLTTLALENDEDTIILVPNIALAHNKATQYPNGRVDYKVLDVWGDTTKEDVEAYERECLMNQPIKIISTYDSLYKIEHLVSHCKIIIDESQKILDLTKGVRRDAVLKMLEVARDNQDRVSFISATPLSLEYLPDWISDIPYVKMNWANSITAKPILAKRTYPFKSLREEFIKPLRDNGSMVVAGHEFKKVVVFINSVTTIQRIIRESKLPIGECAVLAGETIRNDNLLKGIKRYVIGDDVKYLFVTSTGFQGVDIYMEDAMTIAVSSTNKSYTMMDLKTDLQQAISRNRSKTNANYGRYIFIYNQSLFSKSEEELLEVINKTEVKIDMALPYINHCIDVGVGYSADDEMLEYAYIDETGYMIKNEMAFNADKRFIIETRHQYTKGFKVAGVTGQIASLEPIELPRNISYADLANYFRKNHKNGVVDWGVYSTRTDWITIIESLYRLTGSIDTNYTQARQELDAHGDSYKELVFKLRSQFKVGRYSNKDINNKLQKIYDENDLSRRAKSSDLYEIFGENNVKSFNTGGVRGMEILKK